ncbi:hypothetical protein SO802_018672 [Lithocarpus litseifolius]|uniref:Uncharacterized protein n=1 Tax=Lithocarpus litseifolius TaxID=425828 RepID=A0AAW2CLM7_9ROSI
MVQQFGFIGMSGYLGSFHPRLVHHNSLLQKHNHSIVRVPRQRDVKWKPPSAAMKLKTNFDEVMFSESDQAEIGVVI